MFKKFFNEIFLVVYFEQLLEEFEYLVEKMEIGEMSLEQLFSVYECGVGLYCQCQQVLEQVELCVCLFCDLVQLDVVDSFDLFGYDG